MWNWYKRDFDREKWAMSWTGQDNVIKWSMCMWDAFQPTPEQWQCWVLVGKGNLMCNNGPKLSLLFVALVGSLLEYGLSILCFASSIWRTWDSALTHQYPTARFDGLIDLIGALLPDQGTNNWLVWSTGNRSMLDLIFFEIQSFQGIYWDVTKRIKPCGITIFRSCEMKKKIQWLSKIWDWSIW